MASSKKQEQKQTQTQASDIPEWKTIHGLRKTDFDDLTAQYRQQYKVVKAAEQIYDEQKAILDVIGAKATDLLLKHNVKSVMVGTLRCTWKDNGRTTYSRDNLIIAGVTEEQLAKAAKKSESYGFLITDKSKKDEGGE